MINNLNFMGLTMGQMAIIFDFENPKSMEKTLVKTPLLINYSKIMNSKEIRVETVKAMSEMLEKIVEKNSTKDAPLFIKQITLIGVGMFGAALATLIAKENNNNLLFVDEGDTKSLDFYRGNNCVFIKDEIVNGLKTIDIIDKAQKLGHQTLGIISIMNENLPLTRERFNGESGVEKVKISRPCPMYSILTPQSIYKSLIENKEEETAEKYQKMMGFYLAENTREGAASSLTN